jgi:hypothetical protein
MPPEQGDNFMERQREHVALMAEVAAQAKPKPDILVYPEFCNVLGLPTFEAQIEAAEPIPGPTYDCIAEVAAKHKMNIVFSMLERDGDVLRNTSAFIGREAQLIGKYHKYQPTIGEIEAGVEPGIDAPAFDLDFGKVGAAICFDMKYVEVGQTMARHGARMCCFSSMFIAGDRLWHWARDFGMYVVSSCTSHSYIIDMGGGRCLAETGTEIAEVACGIVPPIASAIINMDRMQFHLDYNGPFLKDIFAKYGQGVVVDIQRPEAHFTLQSDMEDVTVDDITAEFGLEPYVKYLDRARGVRADYFSRQAAR